MFTTNYSKLSQQSIFLPPCFNPLAFGLVLANGHVLSNKNSKLIKKLEANKTPRKSPSYTPGSRVSTNVKGAWILFWIIQLSSFYFFVFFRCCVHLHPGNPVNSPLGEREACAVRKNRNLQSNFVHCHLDLGLHIYDLGSAILWIWFLCSRIIWHLVRKLFLLVQNNIYLNHLFLKMFV